MGIQFASDEWAKTLMNELNNSAGYADAAKKWEGDFYFIIDKGDVIQEDIHLYFDLWHGKCREAIRMDDASQKKPMFEMRAPLKVWRGVMEKKIDPIQGLMTRRLKLKGPMMKIMKTPKAAIELVDSCTKLDTEWPE